MTTQLLTAQPFIENQINHLKNKCQEWHKQNISPHLHVVQVGLNQASSRYIQKKKEMCLKIGAEFSLQQFPENVSSAEFLKHFDFINSNPKIHGSLLQLPVSKELEKLDLSRLVKAQKDVDGFHPDNIFDLFSGKNLEKTLVACTPKGVLSLLLHYNINPSGKNVLIIGRSLIVGKPLSILLTNAGATVTLAHSKTQDLNLLAQNAEIIVSAIGKAEFLNRSFINDKKNQVIVDVGINQTPAGKLVGDINFSEVSPFVSAITPVPGGVGPMTVITLMENLLKCVEKQVKG